MKKKKINKKIIKKLTKTWPGILVLIAFFGYQYYIGYESIEPGERYTVELIECVDGDTAWFLVAGEETKVRFLYIDTPESTTQVEAYGEEAAAYVEERLTNAKTIALELNVDGEQFDKYNRMLAWIFVDGELLQEDIALHGYVEKYYDYGYDYTYKHDILKADTMAKENKVGIYQE